MAIFSTKETIAIVEQYRGFMGEALHKQLNVIRGNDKIMEEKHINMLEDMLDKNYDYISNIKELSFEEKRELLWGDIYACIQAVFEKYQNEDATFTVDLSMIEKELAFVFFPLMFHNDLFYYSRELRNYKRLGFKKDDNVKSPSDVVEELLDKLKNGKYVPNNEVA